ncbi:MAG: glutathione S-transferase family protein [Pseudomonadales bacterium]|jgi:glutathione S-transferase|nr:glutathione S-transferase family protein [Pseudomonadales bacterium]MDP6470448.1 glutathione S-transferase family protein [Pseudomonadales bacterium]MDP6827750.1 glutathione S-transferase family protein [Pseudomonadales bacterium]MDP6973392.1 glutathione S-transferase family protein [Pseudomonadales bacterium]
MKFYNSLGPNPQVVRMFAAEKGMDLDTVEIDIMAGENRQAQYMSKNPAGQMPCLELDDGSNLSEITAICEYLDEVGPGASLIGDSPEQRAATRMWTRRVDLNICENMANGFRYAEGLPLFKDRISTIPEAAEGLKQIARERLGWLDGLISGREFIAGDSVSLADVLLFCFLAFGKTIGQPYDEGLANLHAWYQRMETRPSASA